MKNVILAKTAGFCPGVKRAVDLAYGQAGKSNVYTYGPIIHNEEVVNDLERKGVHVAENIEDIPQGLDATVIIRSHGVSRHEVEAISQRGAEVIDATCPFVKRIHRIVEEEGRAGRDIVIIGDPKHPEVSAICGWCVTDTTVIQNEQEAMDFSPKSGHPVAVVSQTTFNYNKFKYLVEILFKKGYDIKCVNTICNATEERQTEACKIAALVDAMIVIGGRSSSNTQKLYEISKKECRNTYYIQTLKDLDVSVLCELDSVGITAGASTPNNIIEEVHLACLK